MNENKKVVRVNINSWFLLPNIFESNLLCLFIKFNLVCEGEQKLCNHKINVDKLF